MTTNMITKRGYQSALSACPAPGAAFAAGASGVGRLRAQVTERVLALPPVTAPQGTGLPIAGRLVADVPSMTFVQLRPGDKARRPPA